MQNGISRRIADEIRGEIERSRMAPGEKLPTENTLTAKYGVSRSTVREAVKLLQAENVIEIRRGLGSFVASNTGIGADPLGLRFAEQDHLLEELMEVRLLMEPGIAEIAAERRTDADLARMDEAICLMEAYARVGKDYTAYDYRFHIALAESTHNRVLERIFPVVFEAIAKGYEQTAHLHGSVDRALWYHRSILGAIRAKDADLSGSLTRQHIEQALRDIAEHRKGA